MSASPTDAEQFKASPVPKFGDKYVKTAACLIIGDEVLNGTQRIMTPEHRAIAVSSRMSADVDHVKGKTKDSNSNFLAKMLFDLAVDLKRIEVIADDEAEISEAVRRMSKAYDLVITSGGIGPTHDDVTYESIAKVSETLI